METYYTRIETPCYVIFYNHSAALCERRNARPFATEPISVAEINHHEQGLDSQVLNNNFGLIRESTHR